MLIINANTPKRMPFVQSKFSKYFETNTKEANINIRAIINPKIHGPRINSEIKPIIAIINTARKNFNFEKSKIYLLLIRSNRFSKRIPP